MNAEPNKALPFGANDRTIARKSAPPDLVIPRIEYITAQRRVRALVASLVAQCLTAQSWRPYTSPSMDDGPGDAGRDVLSHCGSRDRVILAAWSGKVRSTHILH